jgi:hypothetical protein
LRFFAEASEASATTFFTFLGFSALCSGMEAVLHQYILVVKTFDTRWSSAYPYASLPSDLLLRRPLPFYTDVNGKDCVSCESLEGWFGGELFRTSFFLPPLPWAVCLACPHH